MKTELFPVRIVNPSLKSNHDNNFNSIFIQKAHFQKSAFIKEVAIRIGSFSNQENAVTLIKIARKMNKASNNVLEVGKIFSK